jgi:phage terminase large subunit-like protein
VPIAARGAYSRVGADEPDAEIFAAARALIRSIPVDPTQSELLAPPIVGRGVDWDGMGLEVIPDWVDEAHPALVALRAVEPPEPRPWRTTARPNQLPPPGDDWLYWVIMAGRGWGKTFVGANVLAEWATQTRGDYAVIAPTFGDARKICTEGPSGLIAALGDDLESYNKSDYVLYLRNGSRIVLASADAPDRLRGYNLSGAWCDELASYGIDQEDLWDKSLIPALRIGRRPRMIITTTPRRSAIVLRNLLARWKAKDPAVTVTTGSTFENRDNLSAAFLTEMELRYKGTTTGRQELDGEMLDEVEGALVTAKLIDATRILDGSLIPQLRRVVVGVDPSVTNTESSDACGIVVAGLGIGPLHGWTGSPAVVEGPHLYYLADHTMRGTPHAWARKALQVAEEWDADAMIVETNQGGDLCTTMLRMVAKEIESRTPRITKVTASKGKYTRAEPVAGVFEQCRAHIVGGLPGVEDGFTSWVPGDPESPNELDAAAWAAVGLMPQLAMKGPNPARVIAA